MLAAWVARLMGVVPGEIEQALGSATTPPGRWQKIRLKHDVLVINDAYNANPSSVFTAVSALMDQPGKRKLFIFGDMLELGKQTANQHKLVGQAVSVEGVDKFITIGPAAAHAHEDLLASVPSRRYDQWSDDLPNQIADLLEPGDTVLLKGSRGMRLERLIPAIEARFGKAE